MVFGKWWTLLKTHGKRWDLPKLAIPLFKVMSLYFFNTHISDTQIGSWFCELYMHKCSSFLQAIPPKVYHISSLYKCVVSDGTFPDLWMSFPWTWGFSRLFICLLIKPPLFGWKSAIFLDFHRGWPCGKASAPVLWWRSRSAWFSRLPVESWRNGDAKKWNWNGA